MDLKRNSRPKPWISKKRGRNRRGLESGILVRPFEGVASNGFYKTSQWRATREAVLSRDAICQWCLHLGQLNPATDADHVVPLNRCENEGVSGYDQTNIVGSCRSCNSRRASYEANGVRFKSFEECVDYMRKKLYGNEKGTY
tara:strand:+ start:232 stop:657 length:426 start_codon:yes stop_codon:yes gene_type:complete